MDQRPIGVFDSGLGGLTAVHSLWRILPEEDLIYFGDTARVPYGGRSRETLLKYARQDIAFLRSFDLKAVLIACGTVTSTSLDTLRKENDLPVLGVVEPSCREALAVTNNKKIGMIATLASARSGAYERTLKGLDADVQVVSQPCPLFVPLVENGRFRQGDVVIETVAREYLTPLMEAGVDTLILGCTHYPLLKDIIGEICGPGVAFECEAQAGMHINEDHFIAEVIDSATGEVLPPGEKGELVITCISKEALPLIRYRTRDITRLMYEPCACGRTTARMENLSGRTDDMLKIRGVNVFPSQIEEVLINTEGIGPNYEIVVDRKNHSDILIIKVEVEAESMMDSYAALERLEDTLKDKMRLMLGLDAKIQLVSPNTLQRFEGKAKRVTDLRKEV